MLFRSIYGEQRFLTNAVNSYNMVAVMPIQKYGVAGLNINYFGFGDYNEQKIGLIYARQLSKSFSLGLQLDYLSTRIPTYGQANSFTTELGFVYKMNKQLQLGAHAYNLVRTALPNGDRLPTIFKMGIAYLPSEKVSIYSELQKNINNPLDFKLGLEYRPVEKFYSRIGFNTAPFKMSGGFGFVKNNLSIDAAVSYHQILGFSPALSLSYQLSK